MATLEEDLKLGDLTGDMHEHTDRLAMAMPFTLILFALAAFAATILWIVYASMAGFNLDEYVNYLEKKDNIVMSDQEKNWTINSYREQLGYEGAVLGFLVIISYAVVYGALKIAHHHKKM